MDEFNAAQTVDELLAGAASSGVEVTEETAVPEVSIMDKPFNDYTVTEGLLLLIFLLLFLSFILNLIRR